MKNSIAILLVLVLASVGLFARPANPVNNEMKPATINISSNVQAFSAFGVSTSKVQSNSFKSIASFQSAVKSSIDTKVDMLKLDKYVDVGFLSGINNTELPVFLTISVDKLSSGKDSVELTVTPNQATLSPSKDSKFGTLRNELIQVKESIPGAAALAPAGEYETTVTIALVTLA